jgi:hypothetical protein
MTRERRVIPGYSLLLVCFLLLQVHTRPRAPRASGIPHALQGREIHQRLGRIARQGVNVWVEFHVIASQRGAHSRDPLARNDVSNQCRSRRLLPSPRRFSRRYLNLLRLVPPTQDLHRQHRMIEPLQVQLFQRVAFDPGLDHAEDAPLTSISPAACQNNIPTCIVH